LDGYRYVEVVRHFSLALSSKQEESMQAAPRTRKTTTSTPAPVMLLPRLVERMIADRQAVHIAKFRTTCTDCVPNF
jgi:hypothetical protein